MLGVYCSRDIVCHIVIQHIHLEVHFAAYIVEQVLTCEQTGILVGIIRSLDIGIVKALCIHTRDTFPSDTISV